MSVFTNIYGKPEPQYEGCVLDTYEHNGYNDSDWYAICWDANKQKLVHVEYDTTRCGGGGYAEIDATEDTLRQVYRYHIREGRKFFDTSVNPGKAKLIRNGDTVKVIRGRKVPKGTVGKVFWQGIWENRYSGRTEQRVGIEVDGEKKFLPRDYVELVDWETRLITGRKRKQIIRTYAIQQMPAYARGLFEWALS